MIQLYHSWDISLPTIEILTIITAALFITAKV
jgi:hypothetical protein